MVFIPLNDALPHCPNGHVFGICICKLAAYLIPLSCQTVISSFSEFSIS